MPWQCEHVHEGRPPPASCDAAAGDAHDLLLWLRDNKRDVFQGLKRASSVASSDGSARAVCAEVRSLFGIKVRYIGLLVQEAGERAILGRCTLGQRTRTGWVVERDL